MVFSYPTQKCSALCQQARIKRIGFTSLLLHHHISFDTQAAFTCKPCTYWLPYAHSTFKISKNGHLLPLWVFLIIYQSFSLFDIKKVHTQLCTQQEEAGLSCGQGSRHAQPSQPQYHHNYYIGAQDVITSPASSNTNFLSRLVSVTVSYCGCAFYFQNFQWRLFPLWLFLILRIPHD